MEDNSPEVYTPTPNNNIGEPKKKGNIFQFLFVLTLLILVAVVAFWFGNQKRPLTQNSPTPSPTVEAMQTEIPSMSPEGSAMPEETASPTAKPTATPTPTGTFYINPSLIPSLKPVVPSL